MKNFIPLIVITLFCAQPFSSIAKESKQKAVFAGGCFWCMEPPFEKLNGVDSVISGYAGGIIKNPSYKQVSSGATKHVEAVEVTYDPSVISYSDLLEVFWRQINPTDDGGQFVDRGFQYTSAIFTVSDDQKKLALESKKRLINSKRFKKPIVTPIKDFTTFYPAEDYHQDYYKRTLVTKVKYKYYRNASGRDEYIAKHWGKDKEFHVTKVVKSKSSEKPSLYQRPSDEKIKKMLTKEQYKVTQQQGTETPFKNLYWNSKKDGIYVDIVTKEPLFSSTHKYKSGTGWPSFTQPIAKNVLVEKPDNTWLTKRTEVVSKIGRSHLGHVFNDGPQPTGLRYCINSAALEFIPVDELEERGYEKYLYLFKK